MIFTDDERWDKRWGEINEFSMEYETAVIPFSAAEYIRDTAPPLGEQVSELICNVLTGTYFNMESR